MTESDSTHRRHTIPNRAVLLAMLLAPWLTAGAYAGDRIVTPLGPGEAERAIASVKAGLYSPRGGDQELLYVPITFHVVRTTAGGGGVGEPFLERAMAHANTAFGAVGIRFCRPGPTLFIDNDDFCYIDTRAEADALRSTNPVPGTVNVYCTADLVLEGESLCGLSSFTFSSVQGIVMKDACLGNEYLHWMFPRALAAYFDLLATYETGTGAECVDGSNCETAGDLVCDTPADPGCSQDTLNGACEYTGAATDPCHSDPYAPDTTTLMADTYTTRVVSGNSVSIVCGVRFTPQQIARARATLINLRPELVNNCTPDPTVQPCCLPDATCAELPAACCESLGGLPRGPENNCDSWYFCEPPSEQWYFSDCGTLELWCGFGSHCWVMADSGWQVYIASFPIDMALPAGSRVQVSGLATAFCHWGPNEDDMSPICLQEIPGPEPTGYVMVVPGCDCNGNHIDDAEDIATGLSEDCNNNDIPDECEADCDGSGHPDDCDWLDCNNNDIPDECDVDCGAPGGPCDLPGCGQSLDTNGNGRPDECDLPCNDILAIAIEGQPGPAHVFASLMQNQDFGGLRGSVAINVSETVAFADSFGLYQHNLVDGLTYEKAYSDGAAPAGFAGLDEHCDLTDPVATYYYTILPGLVGADFYVCGLNSAGTMLYYAQIDGWSEAAYGYGGGLFAAGTACVQAVAGSGSLLYPSPCGHVATGFEHYYWGDLSELGEPRLTDGGGSLFAAHVCPASTPAGIGHVLFNTSHPDCVIAEEGDPALGGGFYMPIVAGTAFWGYARHPQGVLSTYYAGVRPDPEGMENPLPSQLVLAYGREQRVLVAASGMDAGAPGYPEAVFDLEPGPNNYWWYWNNPECDIGQLNPLGPDVVFSTQLGYAEPPDPAAPSRGVFVWNSEGGQSRPLLLDNQHWACLGGRLVNFRDPMIAGPGTVVGTVYFGADLLGDVDSRSGIFFVDWTDIPKAVVLAGQPLPAPLEDKDFVRFGDFDVNTWGEIAFVAAFGTAGVWEGTGVFVMAVCPDDLGSPPLLGDLDCNCAVDLNDIALFVQALLDGDAYIGAHPDCSIARADCNCDGLVNGLDIQPFTDLLVGVTPPP